MVSDFGGVKSEIRNSKSETNPKPKMQRLETPPALARLQTQPQICCLAAAQAARSVRPD
jgi:hypothetical protein